MATANQERQEQTRKVTHFLNWSRKMNGGNVGKTIAINTVEQETDYSFKEIENVIQTSHVQTETDHLGRTVITDVTPVGPKPGSLKEDSSDATPSHSHEAPFRLVSLDDTPDGDDLSTLDSLASNEAQVLEGEGFDSYLEVARADLDELADTPVLNAIQAERVKLQAAKEVDAAKAIAIDAYNEIEEWRQQRKEDLESGEPISAKAYIATEVDQPAPPPKDPANSELGEPASLNGLPILEDEDHPFIEEPEDYQPLYPVELGTGENAINAIARLLAMPGQHPLLVGHAGTAKDTRLKLIAALTNWPILVINMDQSTLSQDLLGIHTVNEDGTVVWSDGPIPRAVRYGWFLVIDELNAADEGVNLALQQLLENDGKLHLKSRNEVIEPHKQFRFAATVNPVDYGGRNELGDAFMDRLVPLPIPYPAREDEVELLQKQMNGCQRPRLTETEAEQLVSLGRRFRKEAEQKGHVPRLTPRTLRNIAVFNDGADSLAGTARTVIKGMCDISPQYQTEAAKQLVNDELA